MNRFVFVIVLVLLGLTGGALAGEDTFGLAYCMSLPTGDTGDYISNVSFRGASVEWRHLYRRDTAWGFSGGWNVFYESTSGTMTQGDLTATGNLWKYINAVPVYAGWFKHFSTNHKSTRLYFGINGGAAWIERRTDLGLQRIEETNWHGAVSPELGLSLPYSSFISYVAMRYHYAFAAGGAEAQQWLELRIGFGLD